MQFNSVQSGSFLTGAKSVNENITDIYDTAIQTGFNADQVIKQSNANDAVKQMATARRQMSMANTAITSAANTKIYDIQKKLLGELRDIWRPAVRMEGINRMAGSLAAGAYIMDESKKMQKDLAELKLEQQKINDHVVEHHKAQVEQKKAEAELLRAKLKKLQEEGNYTPPVTSTSDTPGQTSTSTSLPVLPSSASSNSSNPTPRQVYAFMKSLKVPDMHNIGILANIEGESGFRTGVMGDNGKSGGLFQMYDDRLTKLVKNVPDWRTNWKGQIVHALKDDRAPEYLITKFDSPVQAANWFLHNYERPAIEHRPGREQLNQDFINSLLL